MAVNPNTSLIYVANSLDDTVSVIQDYALPSVGGVAEAPDMDGFATAAPGTGLLGINVPGLVAQLIGLAMLVTVLVAVAVGGWYAKRRRQRQAAQTLGAVR